MITRIRLEAVGGTSNDLKRELIESAAWVKNWCGGEWQEEQPGLEIQTTATAFWGRLTIRKVTR